METEAKTTIGATEAETTRLQEQAKIKIQSLKEEAVDRGRKYIEVQKGGAAQYIRDFADAMDTAATHLDNMQRQTTSGYVRSASRELKRWSSSLREYGVDSLAQQLQVFAGRHPGMVLGGAAVAGFAFARMFRSFEKTREPFMREQAARPEPAEPEVVFRPPQSPEASAEELGPHS